MIQNHTNSPHHHLTLQQLQEFPNIENKKIIPLLISPFQTDRILHEHLSQQPIVSERSEHSKRIWLAHDQTKVHTLINLMFNQPLNSDTKSNIIVFEGTYHNMLELYQSLKRRLSGYLNLKHEKKKSLKEKYLESHLSKLEFTDMISRFGILGRVELDHDKKENGEYSKSYSFIQTKVKRLPKLETLNRLAQFTIEKAEKIDPLLNGAYIFIPIHSLLSSIKSMDQWEKNGIQISLSEKDFIDIYPQFGVYSPTRREIFSTLIRNACEEFLKNSQMLKQMNNINIIDIGCGTGVFGLFVSRYLSTYCLPQSSTATFNLQFIDINEWAIECTKKNVNIYFNKFGNHNERVDFTLLDISNREIAQQEILSKVESKKDNTLQNLNLLLCNPPWISISKQDSQFIQQKRESLNTFKNVIDLSIFDIEHEFLDNFLHLIQQFVSSSSSKHDNRSQTYGMILISNVGHLLGLEEHPILETVENKCLQIGLKIVRVFTLRRDMDSQKHSLSVREFLVNNPLASKRKKSLHHDEIQQAKENEEVYCVVIGKS
nr:unnamed protein product [Naegleria fowleri]